MAAKVFISYRRDDSAGHAGRVYDRLEKECGRDLVFMDIDTIGIGANFVKVIEDGVSKCDVLLALIGPRWVDARDEKGHRRLDDPRDFVRTEIASALRCGISVIPVLLDGTQMPKAEQLPDELKELSRHNGLDVRHASFHSDISKVVRQLKFRVKIDADVTYGVTNSWFKPGAGTTEWFKDHDYGPEMVVVPAGEYMMGSFDDEQNPPERSSQPRHKVVIPHAFAVGRHAITRGQFAAFINSTNYKMEGSVAIWSRPDATNRSLIKHDPGASWRNPGFHQDDLHPVVCVNWDDARAYTAWLASTTGKRYRLLSEAEWEYVARAGITTPYPVGSSRLTTDTATELPRSTVRVNNLDPNRWGLFNVQGNAWEWCEDVWHDDYIGAPTDGSPWTDGGMEHNRMLRGGSWFMYPIGLRFALRNTTVYDRRSNETGFRVARTLVL